MKNKNNDFYFEIDLKLKKGKQIILDLASARLLYYISKTGTILKAAKILGISYSKAWIMLERIEKSLGERIINKQRGGKIRGYSILNENGDRILNVYIKKLSSLGMHIEEPRILYEPEIMIIGSDDTLLRSILKDFNQKTKTSAEYEVIGSVGGILHILLGDADIVVAHIYDPQTDEYNVPYIQKLGLEKEVTIFRGYKRTLVLASKKIRSKNIEDCINKYKTIATRSIGSGTRIFLDYLLKKCPKAAKPKIISFRTHEETVKAVLNDRAEECYTIEYEAYRHGLEYIKVKDEQFDFIVPKNKANKKTLKIFFDYLNQIKKEINRTVGYKTPKNFLHSIP